MANKEEFLFDMADYPVEEKGKRFKGIETPLWTRNKALFIARYLRTFTYVTKHGTYIDAFSGPQHEESEAESWSAKLVMENEPRWLRNFHLFELDKSKVDKLESLKSSYLETAGEKPLRTVTVSAGDSNFSLPNFLKENPISEKEATFCLFDQRNTECDWKTVQTVAAHKGASGGCKIEIFYFLAQGWIDRAMQSRTVDVDERHERWWGNPEWKAFLKLSSQERGVAMAKRFKDELGYRHAYPFPIQKEGEHGRTMFWMIHASDHDRAPTLMAQAYHHIGAGGGLKDPHPELELGLAPKNEI